MICDIFKTCLRWYLVVCCKIDSRSVNSWFWSSHSKISERLCVVFLQSNKRLRLVASPNSAFIACPPLLAFTCMCSDLVAKAWIWKIIFFLFFFFFWSREKLLTNYVASRISAKSPFSLNSIHVLNNDDIQDRCSPSIISGTKSACATTPLWYSIGIL